MRQAPKAYKDQRNQCTVILVTVSPIVQPPIYESQAALTWWIDGILAEEACQWEEEDRLTREEQECRKIDIGPKYPPLLPPMVTSFIENLCWTIVAPLPAIMVLDILALNMNLLSSEVAKAAIAFAVSHVRSYVDLLKVQTSCGNYLSLLSLLTICIKQVDFDLMTAIPVRGMDDLILKTTIWQDKRWVDRSHNLCAMQVTPSHTPHHPLILPGLATYHLSSLCPQLPSFPVHLLPQRPLCVL